MSDRQLDDSSYHQFRVFLEKQCGIVLGENKQYLVKSRLAPLMAKFDVATLGDLVTRTLSPIERQLRAAVIDAMTTNETLWFRDEYPFELLKKRLLPEFKNQRTPLKIWSAASSSGQEPYSIAMAVQEFKQSNPGAFSGGVQIIGTDISNTMLEHCKYGHYDNLALSRGLSAERKRMFFENGDKGMSKVKDSIKKMVNFRQLNLLNSYSLMGKFDIVFCRNVLIYFAPEIKKQIISQIEGVLNPNGYLFLGASESLTGLNQNFNMVRCNPGIIYQKKK
ncbi:CheR family methyltransferase [Colwellia hornerae]|uniref:protein-glutamate O-methyltransferase n=1 Tax=Colwellia hornerae TaxID=89402 RepID=A0A5C6Q4E6_9GAMM|nr:protein-glutamate O-methyltransferase CheR [Colwellia hornerae]TWX54147.1 protein-glutamate O-methyltransferase CheR [Colwellia hornerae]TWX60922.1 protein-glutamate O-methyltransferase CheR [Colwellia hornerae]TWX63659.1 protein-glutamate O-methyltransferase CheR [Colwellia hornerae]